MIQLPWFGPVSIFVFAKILGEGVVEYQYLLLEKSRRGIEINKIGSCTDIREVVTFIGHLPIFLCLDGKGIITRELENYSVGQYADQLISSILPNVNVSDFIIQLHQNSESGKHYASIGRKTAVDEVLENLAKLNVVVSKLLIGNTSDLSEGNSIKDEISFYHENKKVTMNSLILEQNLTVLSCAINERSGVWNTSIVVTKGFAFHQSEFKFFRMTKKVVVFFPFVLLFLLLANFFFYQFLESKYVRASASIETKKNELDSIALLESIIEQRAEFLGTGSGTNSIPASFYSDRIGETVPTEITLKSLDIFPVVVNQETREIESMRFDTISIKGQTLSSGVLNSWVRSIKQMNWIKGINILNYQQTSTKEFGDFELVVAVK